MKLLDLGLAGARVAGSAAHSCQIRYRISGGYVWIVCDRREAVTSSRAWRAPSGCCESPDARTSAANASSGFSRGFRRALDQPEPGEEACPLPRPASSSGRTARSRGAQQCVSLLAGEPGKPGPLVRWCRVDAARAAAWAARLPPAASTASRLSAVSSSSLSQSARAAWKKAIDPAGGNRRRRGCEDQRTW